MGAQLRLFTELPIPLEILGNSEGFIGVSRAGGLLDPSSRIARVPPIAADFAPSARHPVGLGRAYPRSPAVELLSF